MSDGPDPLPRLSRPRERLRVRLTCRGLALPATLLAADPAPRAVVATRPAALLDATIGASLGRPFRVVLFSCWEVTIRSAYFHAPKAANTLVLCRISTWRNPTLRSRSSWYISGRGVSSWAT